ncbi:hypothetical protein L3X38_043236 [Prunus dulcis]|uniref:Uncharacterized protein n=1 Tax=Prunus dulcis TaxID=3755 RepID=A0AAD4UWC9_PRUDU|nr:hypothetical protein L3X38_043236 [Prunus dulcis]
MSETLSPIFEESSSSSTTLENFQEEGAQQLHETYVSFESSTDGESNSEINALIPPLPPGLTKLSTAIRLGLYSKVKFCNKENTITSDIDPAETTPSKNDPNSSRSFNKVAAAEILVEKQQLEIDTLRKEAMETRSMLQELKAQMEQFVESQAPALLEVAAFDLVDLLSF